MRLGIVLFILIVVLVLAVLLGAGGYSAGRYWSPAGSEVVETGDSSAGAGAGIAAAVLAILVLILVFFGFTQWNWFGSRTTTETTTTNNPSIASPTQQSTPAPSIRPSPTK